MSRRPESVRSGKDAVLAEHRALREIIARLRDAGTRADLLARLLEFRSASRDHFGGEEAPGGFYESVSTSAPRHEPALSELREQHVAFLREADRLAERIRTCTDDELKVARREIIELTERLEAHEMRENDILLEVMNTDLGAGD